MDQMNLSEQQELVWTRILQGKNVVARAVPGAGKTTMLLELCKRMKDRDVLILAYNTDLASNMTDIIAANNLEHVTCYTFHGLCSACISLSPDDVTMKDCLHMVQSNQVPCKKMEPDIVIIDEAQDLKPAFIELINMVCVGNCTQFLVCGDALQMIYDFDPDSYADIAIFHLPNKFLNSKISWCEVTCNLSYRITLPMANLINKLFETNICVSKQNGRRVVIRSPNVWKMDDAVFEHMDETYENNLILVSKKQGNRPLRSLLNALSKNGVPIHLSGYDSVSHCTKKGKLQCSTWHSSKGIESPTCFVIVGNESKTNAMYVALTRALEKLVIFLDPRNPNKEICRTCRLLSDDIDMDDATRRLVAAVNIADESTLSLEESSKPRCRSVDNWKPRHRIKETYYVSNFKLCNQDFVFDRPSFMVETSPGIFDEVGRIYSQAAKLYLEFMYSGRARSMEDCLRPTRMEYNQQVRAIELGHMGRFVAPNLPAHALLPKEVYDMVDAAYGRNHKSTDDYCLMGVATLAWADFHHTLHQLLPTSTWSNTKIFDFLCKRLACLVPEDPTLKFDVRCTHRRNERTVHVRTFAISATHAIHYVWTWETSQKDMADAALRAALHQSQMCKLVNLLTGETMMITCNDMQTMIDSVYE